MADDLSHALASLGPLEARLMGAVWNGDLREPFVVRDALGLVPQLAYTTVMTTLNRLVAKGLLGVARAPGERAARYRLAASPHEHVARLSRQQVRQLRERFGASALAAFAAELETVAPDELERLRRLGDR